MRKIFILVSLFFFAVAQNNAQTLKAEEIIKKHCDAMGFDKLQKVNTIVMEGTNLRNDAMPVKITKMRPDKYLNEFSLADLPAIQAYNGKTGWFTAPWTGNSKPQQMNEARLADMKTNADFENPLYNWKTKGFEVELAGNEKVDNIDNYKIKLTKADKSIEYYFIDCKTFLLSKKLSYKKANGQETEIEMGYFDYKDVNGSKFPYVINVKIGGNQYLRQEFDVINTGVKVEEKVFEMPAN